MKLLLDENLLKKLKIDFKGHQVFSLRDKGWLGIKNGQLLQLMLADGFDGLLTFDKNVQYQQNFKKYTITIFALSAPINTYAELTRLTPKILSYLESPSVPIGPISISM